VAAIWLLHDPQVHICFLTVTAQQQRRSVPKELAFFAEKTATCSNADTAITLPHHLGTQSSLKCDRGFRRVLRHWTEITGPNPEIAREVFSGAMKRYRDIFSISGNAT
jgi:hypothetical protein